MTAYDRSDELPPLVSAHLALGHEVGEKGASWARGLSARIDALRERWSIVALEPIGDGGNDGTGSWVAAATLADGTRAVLKLGFPHFEGRDEIDGLSFWNGDPTVRLLAADRPSNALLLERCVPGEPLSARPEPKQDVVLASLFRRLWRTPPTSHPFRPLAELTAYTRAGRAADAAAGEDRSPITEARLERALDELDTLAAPTSDDRVLATDLHAGNVLSDAGGAWRIIDPKPFVGDPAFDVTQHLLNCRARLRDDPFGLTDRVADLAGVDPDRVRRWLLARIVAESVWLDGEGMADVVRALEARVYHRATSAAGGRASPDGAPD